MSETQTAPPTWQRLKDRKYGILADWERVIRAEIPEAANDSSLELTNSMPDFLDTVAAALKRGEEPLQVTDEVLRIAREHGDNRIAHHFKLRSLLKEYQTLRRAIFKALEQDGPLPQRERDIILDYISMSEKEAGSQYLSSPRHKNAFTERIVLGWRAYFRSFAIVLITTVVQLVIYPWLDPAPFILFYPAIILAALYASGWFAVVLCVPVAHYLFSEPQFSWAIVWPGGALRLAIFSASAAMIAYLASLARIGRRRALAEAKRASYYAARAEALAEVGRLAVTAETLEDLYEMVTLQIQKVMGVSHASLFELAEDGRCLLMRAGRGWPEGTSGKYRIPLTAAEPGKKPYFGQYSLESTTTVVMEDIDKEERFIIAPILAETGIRCAMSTPLRGLQGSLGLLVALHDKYTHFDIEEQVFFAGLATIVAAEIERRKSLEGLREAHKELARSNADLARFASVASHDLKAPLNTITQFLELIEEDDRGRLTAETAEYMRFVSAAADRMRSLIDRLLGYARVGARTEPLKIVNIVEVIRPVLDNLRGAIQKSGAEIVVPQQFPTIIGDDVELQQLFQNLLGNALKFRGSEPPRIELSIESDRQCWIFRVRDNGVGFDPGLAKTIFEPFRRIHAIDQFEGSGLGLAICQRIVARHGGRIWADSMPGRGSTFSFTLPALPPSQIQ